MEETSIVFDAPKILTIQLLRFEFNAGNYLKNATPVICDEKIQLQDAGGSTIIYQHRSTVSHLGSSAVSGHYVAYKTFQDRCYRISDTICTKMDCSTYNAGAFRGNTTETPYLLFYDKIN